MTRFALLLFFKIAFTFIAVVAPYLLLPVERIAELTGGGEPVPSLYRLYGVAILALLVGYASAIPAAQRGELRKDIAVMGLVSNAGATVTLLAFGAEGVAAILAIVFGLIALLLLLSLTMPEMMLRTFTGRRIWMAKKSK